MQYPDSHSFIELGKGVTHYCLRGPQDKSINHVVVLIHGATVPMWEYDRIAPLLIEKGFHCLQYDLYGHGYSDRPYCRYDIDLFVEQLTELLHALEVTTPVAIVGHSLGAAIAAAYCQRFPARTNQLILCAPLIDFEANSAPLKLLKFPLLGELLIKFFVVPMLLRRRKRRYRGLGHGHFPQMFRNQLLKPGFDRALLGLIRAGTLANKLPIYVSRELANKPVLLVRATEDQIVTQNQFEELCRSIPTAEVEEPQGAGHAVKLTDPELVAEQFTRFLSKTS